MAFLKQERPKQFRYIPRFYDEAKEDLQNRIKRVDEELKREKTGEYTPNLKGQFRKRHEAFYGPSGKPSKSSSLGRWAMLLIYFGLVVAIIYLVINILSQVS